MNLLSTASYVESPFIIVKIGDYTFGNVSKTNTREKSIAESGQSYAKAQRVLRVTYPNYMKSVQIVKVNGTVNTYTINMVYQITQGDDPNLLDRVFSSISDTRKLTISYGDWNSPTFIYKEEEALITKVQSNVDFSGSRINYTISCVSASSTLAGGHFDFPTRNAKPSDVIKEILYNEQYGLRDLFYGMRDKKTVLNKNLIASDDKSVTIQAKQRISILDYLNYLVACMEPVGKVNSLSKIHGKYLGDTVYMLNIVDELTNELGGPYFKVTKVSANAVNSSDVYEVDVGYPGQNNVISFSLKDDEQWSILYNYSEKLNLPQYVYRIDDDGNMVSEYSPNTTTSNALIKTTAADKAWWTKVTAFPISATIKIKGLTRPSILMTYVKINAYFYGRKYIASGMYIITRQVDTIDESGYRTELTLTRVGGDDYDN